MDRQSFSVPRASISGLVAKWDEGSDESATSQPASVRGGGPSSMTGVDQSYGDAPVAREERAFAVQRALGTSTYADGLLAPSSDDELRDIAAPLSTSELAREAFRARLIGIAAHREHRSAYEIVFIMLAASLAILLAAPPLVRIFLAMRGIEV